MFYGISTHQEEWKERLNLWIAVAPVTRLDHSKSKLIKLAASYDKQIKYVADYLGAWYILG